MTHAHAQTIRVPWLRHGLRRREAAQAGPARTHAPLLPARARRLLGIGLTGAGAGTVVASAAGLAAAPAPASGAQLVLALAATATVAHCTATAGEEREGR